ncbi:head-tail joining protein [Wolbachia endosymbiont (group B) of Euphydryas aurinia]|uniref:head-tail joining protein n=1 Tax=Wolbachia endosymbiont (group B) of Euphydryas aurinia TaxID=2954014 RepID=UPI002227E3C4|nr:hypothetical protein [Wolbachia endosymbiont (group B) of Euphydryas aurinia]
MKIMDQPPNPKEARQFSTLLLRPMVGDIFVIDGRKYKVYSPPLRDNSGIVWNIKCTVLGEKDV